MSIFIGLYFYRATEKDSFWEYFLYNFVAQAVFILLNYDNFISKIGGSDDSLKHTITADGRTPVSKHTKLIILSHLYL